MKFERLALDSSVRTKDENGHLRIAKTVISKAAVNPYYGREIPNHEELGLDPNKVYHLLRCPDELKRGMDSFKGKQLLIKHVPVDSEDVQKELTIGAIGSDLVFEDDKLFADMTVWDEQAIALIDLKEMEELSSGYSYIADMTAGVWQGIPHDGVMRRIGGNHVALVKRGRIGRDAIICDGLPFGMELDMKLKKGTAQAVALQLSKIAMDGVSEQATKGLIETVLSGAVHKHAFDEDKLRELVGDKFDEVVELVGGKASDEDPKAEDEDDKKAEDSDDKKAEDEDDGEKADGERKKLEETGRDDRDAKTDDKKEKAMDADAIAASVGAKLEAKYAARDAVEPLVGRIALDGFTDASAIYAYALTQKGIAADSAWGEQPLKAMVAQVKEKENARVRIASDSAMVDHFESKSRFKKR